MAVIEKRRQTAQKPRRSLGRGLAAGASAFITCMILSGRPMASQNTSSLVRHDMVTTALELPGYRIVRNLGVVRGITVRSRSVFGTIGAGLQTIVGGNISLFSKLCEQTRADSFELMIQHAAELGANAIISARYDATEMMNGVTEVLAYGTAVMVEPATAR